MIMAGISPQGAQSQGDAEEEREAEDVSIDEIDKMECLCPQFVGAFRRLLGWTDPRRGDHRPSWRPSPFGAAGSISEVNARPVVQIVKVTHANRDVLAVRLGECLRVPAQYSPG